MKTTMTRRGFTGSISAASMLAGAGFSALPGAVHAAAANITAQKLADGLVWIRGAGANLLALKDPQGILFVYGGLKAYADAMLKLALSCIDGGAEYTLINMHWHDEHTGLNEKLVKAGAKIIAHEQTRLWLSTTVRYKPDDAPIRPLPKVAQPNQTTWTDGELAAGGETL